MGKKEQYIQEFKDLEKYLLEKYLAEHDTKTEQVRNHVLRKGVDHYGWTRSYMLYKWHTYIALEVWNGKLIERTYAFAWYHRYGKKDKAEFYFYEIVRKILGNNYTAISDILYTTVAGTKIDLEPYYWHKAEPNRWYVNETWKRDYSHLAEIDDYEDLEPYYDQFKIRYSQYKNPLNQSFLPRMKYLSLYLEYPQIEYLVKNGYSRFISEIRRMNKKGKTIESIFKLSKEWVQELDNDRTLSLYTVQTMARAMEKYKFPSVQHYKVFKAFETRITCCTQELKTIIYNNILVIVNYLIDNNVNYDLRINYVDYLINAYKLNINLNEKKHLCPPTDDFKRLHDEYSERVQIIKDDEFKEGIIATATKIQKLIKKIPDSNYAILIPMDAKELKNEGKALNHCVGSYADRVAKGETAIVFIRKKEELEQPFVTVELKEKRIVQARGKNNCTPPDDVKDFIDIWCKKSKIKNTVFA